MTAEVSNLFHILELPLKYYWAVCKTTSLSTLTATLSFQKPLLFDEIKSTWLSQEKLYVLHSTVISLISLSMEVFVFSKLQTQDISLHAHTCAAATSKSFHCHNQATGSSYKFSSRSSTSITAGALERAS